MVGKEWRMVARGALFCTNFHQSSRDIPAGNETYANGYRPSATSSWTARTVYGQPGRPNTTMRCVIFFLFFLGEFSFFFKRFANKKKEKRRLSNKRASMVVVEVDCWPGNAFKYQVRQVIENSGLHVQNVEYVFVLDHEDYEVEPILRWTFEANDSNLSQVLGELAAANTVRIL